jgi:hypothetical protein
VLANDQSQHRWMPSPLFWSGRWSAAYNASRYTAFMGRFFQN